MASRYSIKTGNWNAAGTWDGEAAVPQAGEDVEIKPGHTVTLNAEIEAIDDLVIRNGGILAIAFDMSTSAFGDISLESGASITYTSGTLRVIGGITRVNSGGGSCGVVGQNYWLGLH